MSDPAKSPAEIEDVLSSIRRLVSEHQAAAPVPPAPVQSPAAAVEDKLVLTPSFRVTEPDDPWVPVRKSPDPLPEAAPDKSPPDTAPTSFSPQDRLANWGDVADTPLDDTSADAGIDVEAAQDPGAVDFYAEPPSGSGDVQAAGLHDADPDSADLDDMARMDGVARSAVRDYEPEVGDDDWPGQGADDALRHLVAARTVHVDARHQPRPPAPDSEPDAGADPVAALPEAEQPDMATRSHFSSPPKRGADEDVTPAPPIVEDSASWTETPSDLSGAGAAAGQDMAPDDALQEAPPAQTAEPFAADDIDDLGEDPSPFTFPDNDEGILDEDTLREIIVDVVRQELQGVLGQRITRNVRKMVRREIRIALAAEDLE
jgi:hypothetical protein